MGVVANQPTLSATVSVAEAPGAVSRASIAAAGLVLAIGAGVLAGTSGHLLDPEALAVELVALIGGSVAAALLWFDRPPGNRIAWLLLAHAVAVAGVALQAASGEVLHSIGVAFDPIIFLVAYVVIFAFPDGRLQGRAERLILAGFSLYLLVRFVPWLAFSREVVGAGPLNGCDATCPENGLMIADRPDLAVPFAGAMPWVIITLLTATVVTLAVRLATATNPRRRTLLPVYVPALGLTIPLLIFHGFAAGVVDLSADAVSTVGWAVVAGRVVLTLGFLVAIAQATFFAGGALKRLVLEIGGDPDARQLRAAVAAALDDPSAELAFRVDDSDELVTSRGEPAVSADPGDGRARHLVKRRGETVAVIWHDPALSTDPELLRVASHALVLALDKGRLEMELKTSNAELVASRARAVAIADAGRRKIERDLHDGAQQHLIALRIKVEVARELAETNPEIATRLADVGFGLDDVLSELRELGQGVSSPVLRDHGLRPALGSVAQRSTPPVSLDMDGIGRYPDEVETAVYYCCLESLQNVLKHAGAGAQAKVSLFENEGELAFVVADDGVGCDLRSRDGAGSGFANMRERVGAVGGKLLVDSGAGRGTRVRGLIPVAGRA